MARTAMLSRLRTGLAVAVWIAVVGIGLCSFLKYETAPGSAGAAAVDWPVESRLPRDAHRAQLMMFVHPRCPCTRASLRELSRIMADCQGLVTAQVLFLAPHDREPGWEKTDLWQTASEIPGVRAIVDEDGRERRRFGIETSGHVLLYNAAGKLIFSGGITASRGESGDNAGESAIVQLLHEGKAERTQTFVFGCPLCKHGQATD